MLNEYAQQVKDMRDAQKAYYKAVRGNAQREDVQNLLVHAKTLEGQIDRATHAILNPPAPGLFTEATE